MPAWYPWPDSNRRARFRKPLLSPPELQGHALTLSVKPPLDGNRPVPFDLPRRDTHRSQTHPVTSSPQPQLYPHNHNSIPTTTSFPRRRESPALRPPTYSWKHPSPHNVTGCIRRMVRGSRIQIPAYAGMTWGCCGNDVMGGNDVRHGPRDSRLRGNDVVGRGNDVMGGNDGGGFSVWRQSGGARDTEPRFDGLCMASSKGILS